MAHVIILWQLGLWMSASVPDDHHSQSDKPLDFPHLAKSHNRKQFFLWILYELTNPTLLYLTCYLKPSLLTRASFISLFSASGRAIQLVLIKKLYCTAGPVNIQPTDSLKKKTTIRNNNTFSVTYSTVSPKNKTANPTTANGRGLSKYPVSVVATQCSIPWTLLLIFGILFGLWKSSFLSVLFINPSLWLLPFCPPSFLLPPVCMVRLTEYCPSCVTCSYLMQEFLSSFLHVLPCSQDSQINFNLNVALSPLLSSPPTLLITPVNRLPCIRRGANIPSFFITSPHFSVAPWNYEWSYIK